MDEKAAYRPEFVDKARALGIPENLCGTYYELLFELATGLVSHGNSLLSLGISGAQGTGKSTIARLLAFCCECIFEQTTLVLSLDDFYLTRAERQALAKSVHPLLEVRGVPGTHDVALMSQVISDLKAGRNADIPVFDKAVDDRTGTVPVMASGLDLLIVEGWCWGAVPEDEARLAEPVNELERTADIDGTWRRWVNEQLSHGGYQELFALMDSFWFLAAPDMEAVFRWRWQQEQQLAVRSHGNRIMDEAGVRRFIMYYERITRHMLAELPRRANLTLRLDTEHRFRKA